MIDFDAGRLSVDAVIARLPDPRLVADRRRGPAHVLGRQAGVPAFGRRLSSALPARRRASRSCGGSARASARRPDAAPGGLPRADLEHVPARRPCRRRLLRLRLRRPRHLRFRRARAVLAVPLRGRHRGLRGDQLAWIRPARRAPAPGPRRPEPVARGGQRRARPRLAAVGRVQLRRRPSAATPPRRCRSRRTVGTLLHDALADPRAWTPALAAEQRALASAEPAEIAGGIRLHPLARLEVRQRAVPLDTSDRPLRFGAAARGRCGSTCAASWSTARGSPTHALTGEFAAAQFNVDARRGEAAAAILRADDGGRRAGGRADRPWRRAAGHADLRDRGPHRRRGRSPWCPTRLSDATIGRTRSAPPSPGRPGSGPTVREQRYVVASTRDLSARSALRPSATPRRGGCARRPPGRPGLPGGGDMSLTSDHRGLGRGFQASHGEEVAQ